MLAVPGCRRLGTAAVAATVFFRFTPTKVETHLLTGAASVHAPLEAVANAVPGIDAHAAIAVVWNGEVDEAVALLTWLDGVPAQASLPPRAPAATDAVVTH